MLDILNLVLKWVLNDYIKSLFKKNARYYKLLSNTKMKLNNTT